MIECTVSYQEKGLPGITGFADAVSSNQRSGKSNGAAVLRIQNNNCISAEGISFAAFNLTNDANIRRII